jgi:hypothetical protein
MAEQIYQDGHKVCNRGCGRLVYTEHTQFPGVCSDCVQPARKKMLAITDQALAGHIDAEEHNKRINAVTIDDEPQAED